MHRVIEQQVAQVRSQLGLSASEASIFDVLANRVNGRVARAELMKAISGNSPRTIDSHIMGIRRKMERHQVDARIETIKGVGFTLHVGKSEKLSEA